MTAQWCPNHESGGTEKTTIRGMTARSAQPKDEGPAPTNHVFEICLAERKPVSLLREPNVRLSSYWHNLPPERDLVALAVSPIVSYLAARS